MRGAVVYVSSNREDVNFENNVILDIRMKCDLPIYSVTQKPVLIENNIVVGDVGVSGFNFCRQLQMAVESADVDYVISCESDCFYSPDYFDYFPIKLDAVYRNTNNYVLPYGKDYWNLKKSQTAFQVAGRDFLLDRLNYLLKDQPAWDTKMKNFPKEIGEPFLESWETFETEYPCFQIKTGNGMRKHTNSGKKKYYKLPYWGKASDVRKKYL